MSDSKMQHFKHKPLNLRSQEIRLFKLKYQQDSAQAVTCEMRHVDLAANPKFKALSYTWGNPFPAYTILLENSEYTISENLYTFLQTKQCDVALCEEWLWVDQICINQSDVQERNHQVSEMANIYRSANCVLIWLGLAFPSSDIALEYLFIPRHQLEEMTERFTHVCNDTEVWRLFFELPYWRRLWICQEVILASEVLVCLGSEAQRWDASHFSYERLAQPTLLTDRTVEQGSVQEQGLYQFTMLEWRRYVLWADASPVQRRVPFTWKNAIGFSKLRSCQDSRDKAYGMLGLVEPEVRIQPDYNMCTWGIFHNVLDAEISQAWRKNTFSAREAEVLVDFMYELWEALGLHGDDPMRHKLRRLQRRYVCKYLWHGWKSLPDSRSYRYVQRQSMDIIRLRWNS